ncbi:Mu transposase C-terminal domain-containing protein [Streptomyces sp. M-16]
MPLVLARRQAVSRLLVLEARGELRTEHARLVASGAGVSLRTVWRWLAVAREEGRTGVRERERFTITPEVHARLARWCGNAAAVHRELLAEAYAVSGSEGDAARRVAGVPSLATLHRAVRRELNPGQRAALSGGERARRRSDVHLRRPQTWRNACWEGDHKHVPVEVDLDGELVFPWVTWFIDCATNAITGAAVTPHQPSRDAILAALRIALSRDGDGPYGPIGGLPTLVRIDRGQDFLSRTVTSALATFAVPVYPVEAYQPHLKGTVENLNRCAQRMLFASLPRYTHQPTDTPRPRDRSKDTTRPLAFTAFVEILLDWVAWWNTEHTSQALDGQTPLAAWQGDPTPVQEADPALLWAFTLEGDGRVRALTTSGVRWRNRYYVGDWMTGLAGAGLRVRVRHVPHHDHEIEVFDAVTDAYLGPAYLADAATPEQRAALRRTRDAEKRRLTRALTAASRRRRERYAAVTRAEEPKRLGSLTEVEAGLELAAGDRGDLAELALPDLIPPAAPPSHWRTPPSLAARTRPRPLPPPAPDDGEPAGAGEPAAGREADTLTGEGDQGPGGDVR